MKPIRPRHPALLLALAALTASGASGCDAVNALLPELAFCGTGAAPADLVKLAEGPAIFVDALRQVALEVGGQTQQIGSGLSQGLSLNQQAIGALGPYQYQGAGAFKRDAASDRAYQLRFYYGDGVPGKTPDSPLEADPSQLSSYGLLNPNGPQAGPLFPLLQSIVPSGGNLAFRDNSLKFDVGSLLKTTLKGYDLQLDLGTQKDTVSQLLSQLQAGKLNFSLANTSMSQASTGFALTIKQFDLAYGLNGQATLGGNYVFQVQNGSLSYFGAVNTQNGVPSVSLRCGQDATSEFATIGFAGGQASFHLSGQNFPISLPGLAPLKTP